MPLLFTSLQCSRSYSLLRRGDWTMFRQVMFLPMPVACSYIGHQKCPLLCFMCAYLLVHLCIVSARHQCLEQSPEPCRFLDPGRGLPPPPFFLEVRRIRVGGGCPVEQLVCARDRAPGGYPWGSATRCGSSPAPRGSSTQWATTGAPETHCGKEWWSRKGKETPTTREGRTKDDGAATVQCKSHGTPRRRTHHLRQP